MTPGAICITSGSNRLRLPSPVNHKVYAELHGVDYRLECGPLAGLKNPYYFKLATLARILPHYEWVVWIDDDAFFTNFTTDIRAMCAAQPESVMLMLADGRVRPGGAWTQINSGVMAVRNCADAFAFLQRCLETDTRQVQAWWQPDVHGMFTYGDQDTVLHVMLEHFDAKRFAVVPHRQLNAREFHYADRLDENFICHFPGVPDKLAALRKFAGRFGVGLGLVPRALLDAHGFAANADEELLPLPRRTFAQRIVRRITGA